MALFKKPEPQIYDGCEFIPVGTWWCLPLCKKILKWIKIVPLAMIKSYIFSYSKDNKDFNSRSEYQEILYSLYISKLDACWRVKFDEKSEEN